MRGMGQFTLKRLFASFILIGIACALYFYADQQIAAGATAGGRRMSNQMHMLMSYLSFGLFGAGIGNIFKRPLLGAIIGVPALIIILMLLWYFLGQHF
jgi:hypothetical protein